MAYTAQLNGRGQKGTSFATRVNLILKHKK